MLVLKRRKNESILIGENITVTILRARGGEVVIGIDAPKTTPVVRTELVEKALAEGKLSELEKVLDYEENSK